MNPRQQKTSIEVLVLPAVVACFLMYASCGGSSSQSESLNSLDELSIDGGASSSLSGLPVNLQTNNSNGPDESDASGGNSSSGLTDYSGKVVIKFKDGTGVRSDDKGKAFVSLSGADVSRVNELLGTRLQSGSLPDVSPTEVGRPESVVQNITRVMTASEEEVDKWTEYWRKRDVSLHDWNLYYYVEVPDYENARELVRELNTLAPSPRPSPSRGEGEGGGGSVIEYASILPKFYLASVQTPDISDEQGYLKSSAEGGLGVEDGWAKLDQLFPGMKLRGQNTITVDQEYDWNFEHEILQMDETEEYIIDDIEKWKSMGVKDGKNVAMNIAHGTAVLGIIAAQGNNLGKAIKGIAPETSVRVANIADGGLLGLGLPFGEEDSKWEKTAAGSILTIEVQQKGITTVSSGCTVGDGVSESSIAGCVPVESHKFINEAIADSTKTGAVIIESAGNGSVDLNNDALAAPIEGMDLYSHFSKPENDSGAIMVGASMGADRKKAPWSNCGSRVDVFAWGSGVVTAGYGDHSASTGGTSNPDNPTSYTAQFGGTSAATAEITGIATMLQSYVRQLAAMAGYNPKTVYLDSKQMRTILKNSGAPAVYGQTPDDPNPDCNIGVQPDLGTALDYTNEFLDGNALNVAPLNAHVVSGIRYDMDGDDRADLISFSKDHKWYIDFSSVPCESGASCGDDGYGEWDVILSSEFEVSKFEVNAMLFPAVHDYNSDGRADLALYDSINGKWYIKYTSNFDTSNLGTSNLIWDRIIDYSSDPAWKAYSRPVPGDYNGDRWLDVALQTPDGHWLIDYGGFDGVKLTKQESGSMKYDVEYLDKFGVFDEVVKYLTNEQLAQAPGWAWLAEGADFIGDGFADIIFKSPDGISAQNKLYVNEYHDDGGFYVSEDFLNGSFNALIGDNDSIFSPMKAYNEATIPIGVKNTTGGWQIGYVDNYSSGQFLSWENDSGPIEGYGDINCLPIPADYDGDGKDDRAVQCGSTWKIAYSDKPSGDLREVELEALDPLPSFVYSGGLKYQDVLALYNYYKDDLSFVEKSNCSAGITDSICKVQPPIGPYFANCVKYWSPNASYCWDK